MKNSGLWPPPARLPVFFLCMLGFFLAATAQTSLVQIDSLLKTAEKLRFSNRDSSKSLYEKVLVQSDEAGHVQGQIEARMGLAWISYILSDYSTTRLFYQELKQHFHEDLSAKHFIEIYTRTGTMFLNEGLLDSARFDFTKVQEIQAVSDFDHQTNIGTLLSELYFMLGRYDEAEQYALNDYYKFKNGPKQHKAVALYALMQFYLKRENIDSFIRFNNEYLESIDYDGIDPEALKYHYHSLFTDDEGNRDLSKITLLIEAAEKSGHDHIALIGYAVSCEQYFKEENLTAIGPICEKAIKICRQLGWVEQEVIYLNHWAKAEAGLGNFRKAYSLSLQLNAMKQKIANENSQERIDELEIKYATSEKERQLESQKFEIERKTRQRNASYLGLGYLLVFCIGLFVGFRNIIKKNKQLAQQESELQSQKISQLEAKNKIDIMDSIMLGQEDERKRIANDLHDGLGSLMASVKTHFRHIENEIKQLHDLDLYQKTSQLIDQAVVEVRRISHNMMPKALEENGLQSAIMDLAGDLQKTHPITITVEMVGLDQRLPASTELMMYRIIQEMVSNTIRHADANTILIQLVKRDERLFLLVEDDGCGFDPDLMKDEDGLGLNSMQSRVKYLLGNITIDSETGVGTTIMVDVPLSTDQQGDNP